MRNGSERHATIAKVGMIRYLDDQDRVEGAG